jgi:transposase
VTRVELFELIRRDRVLQEASIRGIAQKYRVHRRTVRQAIESAIPPPREYAERDPPVLTIALRHGVDKWLREDREAPRKQRHTARRVFQRLVDEYGFQGAESTVRRYVGLRRREIGLSAQAYVPQTYQPGKEAEVDWYEALVAFPDGRRTVNIFQMRACYSGREFHWASPRRDQQALLEAHVEALTYFGGVFPILRFDNMSSVVKKVLRGRRRQETDRFVALRSHYLFESEFCRPGKEGAPEKGGVESGVGRFRRNHLVPVPRVESYEDLNGKLRQWCAEDDQRRIANRQRTVIEQWGEEQPALRALPAERFPTAEVTTVVADSKSRVQVRTNRYSVPVRLVGCQVEARLHTHWLDIRHAGRIVASHERLHGRFEQRLKLDHYLELLQRKPGALQGCVPLRQARDAGRWPECYDRLWQELKRRNGESEGTRRLLDVLMLHREARSEDVHTAVKLALAHHCFDAGAVSVLLRQLQRFEAAPEVLGDLGELARYDRPAPTDLSAYDSLYVQQEGRL